MLNTQLFITYNLTYFYFSISDSINNLIFLLVFFSSSPLVSPNMTPCIGLILFGEHSGDLDMVRPRNMCLAFRHKSSPSVISFVKVFLFGEFCGESKKIFFS